MKKSLIVGSFLALTALAGCNGSTTTGSGPVAVVTPSPVPTAVPSPQSSTVTSSSLVTGAQVTAPAVGGISGTFTLPSIINSLNGSSTLTASVSAPPSTTVPVAFSSIKHAPQSTRHALAGVNTPIYFLVVQPPAGTGSITFSGTFTASFTIPSTAYPTGSSLYLAAYYPGATSWVDAVSGPGTVNSSTGAVSFTATTSFTLSAGQTYALAIYYTTGSQTTATLPCTLGGTTSTINLTSGTAASSGGSPITIPGSGTLGYNVTPAVTGSLGVIPFSSSMLSTTGCPANTLKNTYGGIAVNPSANQSLTAASFTYTNTSPSPAFNVSGSGTSPIQLIVLNASNPSAGWVNLTSMATFGPVTGGGTVLPISIPSASLNGASLLSGNQYLFVLGTN
jgi:hypothetical protein